MIDKTGGRRGPRRAAALAAVAGIAVLTGCSTSPVSSGGTASAHSVTYQENLAFAHCLQTHGVPDFPDPNPSASATITISGHPAGQQPCRAGLRHLPAPADVRQRGNGQRGNGHRRRTGSPSGD